MSPWNALVADYACHLRWIDDRRDWMLQTVRQWSGINTASCNLTGLGQLNGLLKEAFKPLGGQVREVVLEPDHVVDGRGELVDMPLGIALCVTKRPQALLRVFLGIHSDTVYPPDHPFQGVSQVDNDRVCGPGVADAKGGLVVLITALDALEHSPWAKHLGWQVVINPDEEIGSPGSVELLRTCAGRNHLGLVYEPTLPEGSLISSRKGSGNFTCVVRGRSAHVGRNAQDGRNAIDHLARLMVVLGELGRQDDGVTINMGKIEGGGPVNVVADLAIVRFNVRVHDSDKQSRITDDLQKLVGTFAGFDGISVQLHGGFQSPPKPLDDANARILDGIMDCGQQLNMNLTAQPSGGVCDGNKLAAAGLPNIDTLGPVGGNLHSDGEYLVVSSLVERAKLSALLLMKLATGELELF